MKMLRAFFIYFPTYLSFLLANFIQNVILPVNCGRLNDGRVEMNKYRSIASCIAQISERELFWRPTVLMKIEKDLNENKREFNKEMFKQIAESEIPYIAVDASKNTTLNISAASYLFISYFEDCEALTALDFDALEKKIKYLIILDNVYSDVCELHFKGVKNVMGEYDISVFVKNSNDQYDLYTYVPDIDPKSCKVVIKNQLKINTCSNGELLRYSAFPQKVPTNLNKCPFKVGMGALYPFATIENISSLQTYDRLDTNRVKGMDSEIIKIMTAYFNATLDLYYIYKPESNPYVNIDYLPLVLNGTLDACAGGLYRIFGDLVEYSGIYARQTVMWIYSVKRVTRTWDNMVMSIDGLYLFIIFYLSYSIAWCLVRWFDKDAVSLRSTLLYSWGALVGATSLKDAKSLKQKILNIVYLLMCLHLSVYISIQLYSFFTIRGPPEMLNTNDDIMNSGRTAFLKTQTKYFIKDEKYIRFANTSKDCSDFYDCAKASLLHKGLTVTIESFFYPFQAATSVNDEARMLRAVDNVLTVYYEMIIRKESPLVLKFQKVTGRLFEAGITEKLFNEAIGLTIVRKAKIASQNMATSSYACEAGCKLYLEQFSGVFYVWGFFCIASCFLFIVEILTNRAVGSQV